MLKQFKIIILAPTCFGSRRNHHQGAVLCLAKTTNMVFFSFLFVIDTGSFPIILLCGRAVHRGESHACTTC
jgi:hypothetical protein